MAARRLPAAGRLVVADLVEADLVMADLVAAGLVVVAGWVAKAGLSRQAGC